MVGEDAVRPGRPKRIMRVCWESLAESPVRESFNSHLRESFDHVPGEAGDIDIESEWATENDFRMASKRFWDHHSGDSGGAMWFSSRPWNSGPALHPLQDP